jgi:adenine/guanine phosphoribosyltransferase-like PRPP-binding protein
MSSERLSPTKGETEKYLRRLNNISERVGVTTGATVVFAAASSVFPPAAAGALVTGAELVRQGVKLGNEFFRFNKKDL